MDQMDPTDPADHRDPPALKAPSDHVGSQASREGMEPQGRWDGPDFRVSPALRAPLEPQGPVGLWGLPGLGGPRACAVPWAQMDPQDNLDPLGALDPAGLREMMGGEVRLERRVWEGPLDLLVSLCMLLLCSLPSRDAILTWATSHPQRVQHARPCRPSSACLRP